MKNSIRAILTIITIWATAAACTDAGLCYNEIHPHGAGVKYVFEWDNYTEHPDTMGVINYRIVNLWKSLVAVNSDNSHGRYVNADTVDQLLTRAGEGGNGTDGGNGTGSGGGSGTDNGSGSDGTGGDNGSDGNGNQGSGNGDGEVTVTPGQPDDQPTQPDDTEGNNIEMFNIHQGEYKFITFPLDTTEISLNEVADFVKADGGGKKMQDIHVNYKEYKRSDKRLKKMIPGWDDFNSYALYIQPDMQPLFYDTVGIVKANLDDHLTVTFHPKPITQNVDVYFNIQKDIKTQPFVIDSVWAEIGGVPRRINLSNGELDITRTNKMLFPMELTSASGGNVIEDNETNDLLRCHANIDVTSIVNAKNDSLTTGPGIMQVIIYTHATHNGKLLRKKMQGKINLFHTISEAEPIKLSDDGQHAARNGDHVVLDINAELIIDGRTIVEHDDNNQGLDRWIAVSDDIIVDI